MMSPSAACVAATMFGLVISALGDLPKRDIAELTPEVFHDYIGKKDVLVLFSMPECGGCKRFQPDFEELAGELVSMDDSFVIMTANTHLFDYEELKEAFNISTVPALRLFLKADAPTADNPKPKVPITIPPNEAWKMGFFIKEELGLPVPNKCQFGDSDARDVTSADWEQLVNDPKKTVLVEFYAPWCKHCKAFKSTYNLIASKTRIDPQLSAVRVNADMSKDLMKRFDVKRLPTFYIFPSDNKTGTVFPMPTEPVTKEGQSFEVVNFVMKAMKMNNTREAQALEFKTRLEALAEGDAADEFMVEVEEQQGVLNTTVVWEQVLGPLLAERMNERAAAIKDQALGLVGKRQFSAAMTKLRHLQDNYADTEVAKSDTVANLIENIVSMAQEQEL